MKYKFRGKTSHNREWVYGSLILNMHDEGDNHIWSWHHLRFFEVDPKTVGMCSGLPDEKGTDIYEGDHFGEPSCPVTFEAGAFWHDGELLRDYAPQLEVKGDVH